METLLLDENQLDTAAKIIRSGGLVAIPTETVYGLAANALNGDAVKKIYQAKGRPSDNPLIVHVCSIEQLKTVTAIFPKNAQMLINAFCPGPLTVVLPKSSIIPDEISAGLDSVAVRFPSHPIARKLIEESDLPLAAPSANLSGSPSPTSFEHVKKDLFGRVDAIIDGGNCSVGVESTVISLCTDKPRILRPGAVTAEQIKNVIGEVEIDPAVKSPLKKNQKVLSPGMKYKHYSPKAHVILIDSDDEKYIRFVNNSDKSGVLAMCYDEDINQLKIPYISLGKKNDYITQAKNLFSCLRFADDKNCSIVYAHLPDDKGVSLAVYNRLIRAAGFEVIKL